MKSSAMHIVLLDRIRSLGGIGDVVAVRRGYARNYLLPQGKALRATKHNIQEMEKKRAELEKKDKEALEQAQQKKKQLQDLALNFIRQASESGQLYGSVSVRDVKELLKQQGHDIPSEQIMLSNRIKEVGLHSCMVVLHADVTVSVMLNVARNEDESQTRWKAHLEPQNSDEKQGGAKKEAQEEKSSKNQKAKKEETAEVSED